MSLHLLVTVSVILQQIILVPVFSTHWSQELYGSWLIIFATANLLILADFGLNPLTYNRLQSQLALGEGSAPGKVRAALANSMFAYGAMCLGLIVALPLAAFLLPLPRILGLSGESETSLRVAFVIAMLGGTCSVLIIGLSAVMRVTNRINGMSLLRICTAAAVVVFMYLAVIYDFGIVGVASAYAGVAAFEALFMFLILVPRALGDFKAVRMAMRTEPLWATLNHARQYLIPISADTVLQSVPTFMMGLVRVPAGDIVIFTLARVISSCIRQVVISVMFAISSSIGYAWTQGNKKAATYAILLAVIISGVGIGAGLGYVWSFHGPLVRIWTGGVYEADPVVFGLLFIAVAVGYPATVAWHALVFIGEPLVISKTKSAQIVLLCLLCLGLGLAFGVRGVAASVLVSELVAVSIPLAVTLCRRFSINVAQLLMAVFIPTTGMFALSLACAELAQRFEPPTGFWSFGVSSLLWLPVPLSAALFVLYLAMRSGRFPASQPVSTLAK